MDRMSTDFRAVGRQRHPRSLLSPFKAGARMKPAEVRKQIKPRADGPLYLLEGDDLQSRHDLALEFAGARRRGPAGLQRRELLRQRGDHRRAAIS